MRLIDFFLLSQNNKVDLTNNLKTNIMKNFTPIAMRCTKEQFKAIEPKLKKYGLEICVWGSFEMYPYLCNNRVGNKGIGNYQKEHSRVEKSNVYETWDEATFLKACGIEVDTYTVSKDFILEAHKDASPQRKLEIENEFKELFQKVELEIGKWLKDDTNPNWLMYRDGENIYGFDVHGNWFYRSNKSYAIQSQDRLATKEEVETALINELDKKLKGKTFREVKFIDPTTQTAFNIEGNFRYFNDNGDWCHLGNVILSNKGKWAEIIYEPIEVTLEQIAEKFGVEVEQIKIKK